MRDGEDITFRERGSLIFRLSLPAILSQLSMIVMQYIDASMVGSLGASESASIGLVASTTWLLQGFCVAMASGFTVQVAHEVGAKKTRKVRGIIRHGLFLTLIFSIFFMILSLSMSRWLPVFLGGAEEIREDATVYFAICSLLLPAMEMSYTAGGMLSASGDMTTPSVMTCLCCVLDVLLNALLIYPTRGINLFGHELIIPGAGLRVAGAAWATVLSEFACGVLLLYFLLFRSGELRVRREKNISNLRAELRRAARISLPAAFESLVSGGAYVIFTMIVAPLGTVAVAANSFAITAESLCYMPGYGISSAATTVVGQGVGAGRRELTRSLAWMSMAAGIAAMALSGVIMYCFAPAMIGFLSPDPGVRHLGVEVLRIEAFAEPMFAASIVGAGIMKGMGDTLTSGILNIISMWIVRLPLAFFLSRIYGLQGAWMGMCFELFFRGCLFLAALFFKGKKRLFMAGAEE